MEEIFEMKYSLQILRNERLYDTNRIQNKNRKFEAFEIQRLRNKPNNK